MLSTQRTNYYISCIRESSPTARAVIRGSSAYPNISGSVSFYSIITGGVLVVAEVSGLPAGQGVCYERVFGMHIHEGGSCTGNESDPFSDTGGHFNPEGCPHPKHAGDMPPLFGNNGYAWSAFFTRRFNIREIIGRTVIIHEEPDDFTTQPSGNSGKKIACGEVI